MMYRTSHLIPSLCGWHTGAAEGALAEHFKVLITAFQSVEPESGAGIDHDSLLRSAFAVRVIEYYSTEYTLCDRIFEYCILVCTFSMPYRS